MRRRRARVTLLAAAWIAFCVGASDARAGSRICISADTFVFGNVLVGTTRDAVATVSSCGDSPLALTGVNVDPLTGSAFQVTTTCATGLTLAPGSACTVAVRFAPLVPGQTSGALWLHNGSATPDQLITFYGRGVDSSAGTASLVFIPAIATFGAQAVGTESAPLALELKNVGASAMSLRAIVLNGPAAYDFRLLGSCQVGGAVVAGGSCYMSLYFRPQATGSRLANLVIDSPQLASLAVLQIAGTATPPAPSVDVVEYYNAALDHYFMSSFPADLAALDAGVFPGWTRTGLTFKAYAEGNSGSSPVCRFYMPPAYGNSHFYSASPAECAQVRLAYPAFVEESAAAMYVDLPDAVTGACPLGDIAVYRMWNKRADSNHRYTVDRAVRAQMVARGWIAEGYGPDQVIMCAPARP